MKAFSRITMVLLFALSGLLIGSVWSKKHHTTPQHKRPEASPPAPQTVQPSSKANRTRLRNIESPLLAQLKHDLSLSNGVATWLTWLDAIENADLADFPHLARLAHNNMWVTRLLAARWFELNPRSLFDAIVASTRDSRPFPREQLGTFLLREWTKRDPDAIVAALNEESDFGLREDWRRTVAASIIDNDPERGLRLFSQWNVSSFGPDTKAISKWAASDPAHAARFVFDNPADFASMLAIEAVGREWVQSNPAEALQFAQANPGGLGTRLSVSVLEAWAKTDLNAAAKWLLEADPSAKNRYSPIVLKAWAEVDMDAALAWCETNLKGLALADGIGSAFRGAANGNLFNAANVVKEMKPSPARRQAALAVAQNWIPNNFGFDQRSTMPKEVIAWMTGLDVDSQNIILDQFHTRWAQTEPKSLAEFLASTDGDHIKGRVFSTTARNLARQEPAAAFEWLNHIPEPHRLSAGADAWDEWRQSQPEEAIHWLNDIPDGDPRRRVYFHNAIYSIASGPHALEEINRLSTAQRAEARETVSFMINLPQEKKMNLLKALEGP